jgi:hypothetical protein
LLHEPFFKGLSLEPWASASLWGENGRKTLKSFSLCRRGDLRHDLSSEKKATQKIYPAKTSLESINLTERPTPLANCDVMPLPWKQQPTTSHSTSYKRRYAYTASGGLWSNVRDLWSGLDLHSGAVRRVHSTFISEFSVETHKLEVAQKQWEGTTEIRKVPAGETGVS